LSTICAALVIQSKTALFAEYPTSGYPVGVIDGAAQVSGSGEIPLMPNSEIQSRVNASTEPRFRRNRV
jgi:hypothetical protein